MPDDPSTQPVNDQEIERSESGVPIIRHQPRSKPFEAPSGSEASSGSEIASFIKDRIGRSDWVWHEIISDLIHIDLHMVNPTPARNFYTIVTSGMSDKPMKTPPGAEAYQYSELLICLPPSWSMKQESFSDESVYWPLRWLKILARFPHEYDAWLGVFHTIPNGDPAQPYAKNTRLCCAMLTHPMLFGDSPMELRVSPQKTIHFYSIVPLYKEEMEFKLKNGRSALTDKFIDNNVSELLDPKRKNVCSRGIFGH
jgi:suppressor of fused protein SUFU